MGIIKIEKLSIGYEKRIIAKDLDFSIRKGAMVSVMGCNGSGKSTLLKTFSKLLKPISGDIFINNKNLKDIKSNELAKLMAVVLTNKELDDMITAYEVVSLGRFPYTNMFGILSSFDNKKILECLEYVNAIHLKDRYFNSLSDGEKQKVLIARALAQDPEIIILDEPTTHLDVKYRIEILSILRQLCFEKKITVVMSIHEIDLALKISDYVLLIKDGEKAFYGIPEELPENILMQTYDISKKGFCSITNSVELVNNFPLKFFVVGGGHTAIKTYRILTKNRIGFVTGVLNEKDIDYLTAKAMGVDVIHFNTSENNKLWTQIDKLLDQVEGVIDTGFVINDLNRINFEIIFRALKINKRVLSLRENKEIYYLLSESNIENIGIYIDKIELCDVRDCVWF